MTRFGYPVEKWETGVADENFRQLMKDQVERTRELFYRGAELPSLVEELQLELKLVWFGGMSVSKRPEKIQYDVFHRRPALKWNHKLQILARGCSQVIWPAREKGRRRGIDVAGAVLKEAIEFLLLLLVSAEIPARCTQHRLCFLPHDG